MNFHIKKIRIIVARSDTKLVILSLYFEGIHRILKRFSKIASYLATRTQFFLVAKSFEAVLLMRPFVIYTLQVSFTILDTFIVGFEDCTGFRVLLGLWGVAAKVEEEFCIYYKTSVKWHCSYYFAHVKSFFLSHEFMLFLHELYKSLRNPLSLFFVSYKLCF